MIAAKLAVRPRLCPNEGYIVTKQQDAMKLTECYVFHFIFRIYPLEHGRIFKHIWYNHKSYSAAANEYMLHVRHFPIPGGGLDI